MSGLFRFCLSCANKQQLLHLKNTVYLPFAKLSAKKKYKHPLKSQGGSKPPLNYPCYTFE